MHLALTFHGYEALMVGGVLNLLTLNASYLKNFSFDTLLNLSDGSVTKFLRASKKGLELA